MTITAHKHKGKPWGALPPPPAEGSWLRRQLDAMGPPIILRPTTQIYQHDKD